MAAPVLEHGPQVDFVETAVLHALQEVSGQLEFPRPPSRPLRSHRGSAEEDVRRICFNLAKNVAEAWHVVESLVRVPAAVAIAPFQRPAANGGTVHELRKYMLSVPSPILKMRPALEQEDGVATKLAFVRQLRQNQWRRPVAELVERSLDATAFEFRERHLASLIAS